MIRSIWATWGLAVILQLESGCRSRLNLQGRGMTMKKLVPALALGGLGLALPSAVLAGVVGERLCGDLQGRTPGLLELCMDYWDYPCAPDWTLEDPFEVCRPESRSILENYWNLMEEGDPDMPGVPTSSECPCWTDEEIQALPYPSSGTDDPEWCEDFDGPKVILTGWYVGLEEACRWGGVGVVHLPAISENFCWTKRLKCRGDQTVSLDLEISAEKYETCRGQVIAEGVKRGICFD
jgi:hypothetical protein